LAYASPSNGTVVVVVDTDVSADVLRRYLISDGYRVEVASDGPSGLEAVRRCSPDLVLLDVLMPGMSGFEACRCLKSDPLTRLTPVVLVTALDARDDRILGVEAGADDFLSKPIDVGQLRARIQALLRAKHFSDDLDSAEEVIMNLARTVEARDPSTEGHCERPAAYTAVLGAELAFSPEEIRVLHRGAQLHDVGKIVDVFDALTTPRPYRQALTFDVASGAILEETARGLHDPGLAGVLVAMHRSGRLDCALASTRLLREHAKGVRT
jgi:response regulator RpfG family c-di-GMP phosphodiesterase